VLLIKEKRDGNLDAFKGLVKEKLQQREDLIYTKA
jgi:hypothetical protein